MFHTGTTKAGGHSLLCVANKRRVIIYEFTKIKGVCKYFFIRLINSRCLSRYISIRRGLLSKRPLKDRALEPRVFLSAYSWFPYTWYDIISTHYYSPDIPVRKPTRDTFLTFEYSRFSTTVRSESTSFPTHASGLATSPLPWVAVLSADTPSSTSRTPLCPPLYYLIKRIKHWRLSDSMLCTL